jgi:hypothetical protein
MLKIFRRRAVEPPWVELCETCGEACTAGCRARARQDRARTLAYAMGLR